MIWYFQKEDPPPQKDEAKPEAAAEAAKSEGDKPATDKPTSDEMDVD